MENSHSDGQLPMTAFASEPESITNASPPLSSPSTCLAVQNPKTDPQMTKKRSIAYVDDDDSSDGKKGKRHLPNEEEEEEPYMVRDFTKEEKWIYNKVAMESENFDCVDVPYEVFCPGLLYPVHIDQLPDDMLEMYVDMAKLALTSYNKQHDTSFQCVKVIKATTRLAGRMLYHITFQAKDDVAGSTQNFQTTVSNFNGEDRVDLCRFEQKPKPLEVDEGVEGSPTTGFNLCLGPMKSPSKGILGGSRNRVGNGNFVFEDNNIAREFVNVVCCKQPSERPVILFSLAFFCGICRSWGGISRALYV